MSLTTFFVGLETQRDTRALLERLDAIERGLGAAPSSRNKHNPLSARAWLRTSSATNRTSRLTFFAPAHPRDSASFSSPSGSGGSCATITARVPARTLFIGTLADSALTDGARSAGGYDDPHQHTVFSLGPSGDTRATPERRHPTHARARAKRRLRRRHQRTTAARRSRRYPGRRRCTS
jgi:hypothetical protein